MNPHEIAIDTIKNNPEETLLELEGIERNSPEHATEGLYLAKALCLLEESRFQDVIHELNKLSKINPSNEYAKQLLQKTTLTYKYHYERMEGNRLLNNQEFLTQSIYLKSVPSIYIIGLTNVCQLHCPLCVTGLRRQTKGLKFMDIELFKDIVEKVKDYATLLQLFKWGESLLHKDFVEMLRYTNRYNLNTELSSNLALDGIEDKLEAMVKYRLKHLIVSFDGVTQEDYERYRRGGRLDVVLKNIRLLAEIKKRYNRREPKISLQFLKNKYTGNQIEILKQRYKEWGADEFYIDEMTTVFKERDIQTYRQWFDEDEINRRGYLDVPSNMLGKVCYFLYTTMIIEQDGSIPACCFTTDPKDDYSNWDGTKTVNDLFNSERFVNARKLFRQRGSDTSLTCNDCSVFLSFKSRRVLPFISVIIPTYNRAEMLAKTIESFINQTYPKERYEIVIADNNSQDKTKDVVEHIKKTSDVNIKYIFEQRQGVHYARNKAAMVAGGDILYYTDDDMVADKELLMEISLCFLEDNRVGSATGKVLPLWEAEPPEWVLRLCQNAYLSLHDRGDGFFISDDDFGVYSCHMAIRREIFFECGGFNPENTAGEWIGDGETGLNIKIREKGYRFAYNGKAITYHMIPPSRMTQEYLNKRLANQGNCDSYTEYKRHRFTREQLLQRINEYAVKLIEHTFMATQKKKAGDISWRIHEAYRYYFMNRMQYDCRLMFDKDWQELVLRDSWIDV